MNVVILDLFGRSGGVGRCTREILRELEAGGVSTMLCGRSHVVDSFKDCQQTMPHLCLNNLERPKLSLRSLAIRLAARRNPQSSRLADALLRETKRAAGAAGNGPQFPILVNYPQMVAPPSGHGNFCLFLHDLNWQRYPGNFQDPDVTDRNCRGWVESASKVITNSECTRDEVMERYKCASDKVVAAPLAPFGETVNEDFDASHYLGRLGLMAGHFYLFPGVWGLHKGHDTLTDAIEMSECRDPVVVTCGKPLDGIVGSAKAVAAMRRSLAARWENLIAAKKLVVVGCVPELEMQALRAGCRGYVLPSQYEGFGFPLVEAVYHHRPAIVSDIKAHQEILNRYPQYKLATLFSPFSPGSLAAALNGVSPERVRSSTDWARKIEATWSWENTVRRILSALASATA